MRTNIEIDDELMEKAMRASQTQARTKKALVEEALALLVRLQERADGLARLRGKIKFDPDYDYKAMRGDDPVKITLSPQRMRPLQKAGRERRRRNAA